MSNKRILIVQDDRLLTNLYREKLQGSNFTVDAVRTFDQVANQIEARKPDLILLDLVSPAGSAVDFIQSLRNDPATMEIPVVVFPTGLTQLTAAAMHAGATKIVARSTHPVAATLDTVKVALGMTGLGNLDAAVFQPDDLWLSLVLTSATDNINQMRQCVPGLLSSPPDMQALRLIWSLAHAFGEKTSLLSSKALGCVACALDLMLADINETPELITQSTLRTISQAIDFLAHLSIADNLKRTSEPSVARILVVDDEEGARNLIGSALGLAGLKCEYAESSAAAMEKLDGKKCDLIFLDVGMPGVGGLDLCTKLRGDALHQKTPVVFLTGMVNFQTKAQASLSGGNDFIGKPFALPELALKALTWVYRSQLGMQ